jgi:uncharacterized protein YfbU (UPF0304 family)
MKVKYAKKVGRILMIAAITQIAGARLEAQIPILDIINAAAKKVVVAIDLKVQELQTQTIQLQVAEKDLENSMEDSELGDITGWVKGEEQLYASYYRELWQVKAVISAYKRVTDMLDKEAQIVREYQQMTTALKADKHLTAGEVEAMGNSLSSIVSQSVNNLGQIKLVIQAFVTQMPDAGRLRIIDGAGSSVDKNYAAMEGLYQSGVLLSLNRARDENDVAAVRGLWGIE